MNVLKTNLFGINILKSGFATNKEISGMCNPNNTDGAVVLNTNLLRHNPNAKTIRVSKGIMDACALIDIESIKQNISDSNFNFRSINILLDNDHSGLIKVERFGSDFSFLMLSNLMGFDKSRDAVYNSYSFTSKSFYIEKGDECKLEDSPSACLLNYNKSVFAVQLLTYLVFGDISEKYVPSKKRAKLGSTRILNNSKLNITFCDTLWKQRINTDGFKVRGHFRLQPVGEGRRERKLIWIEEFDKKGYNRKATVEMI
jgi:hypothetical protein